MATEARLDIDRVLGTAADVMQTVVVVLHPDQSLGDAARELERAGISGAPVVEGGRIVGMADLHDLFEAAGVSFDTAATSGPWHRYEHLVAHVDRTVGEVMHTRVITVPPEAPITEVAGVMRALGTSRVPVVDEDGALRGIVARDDVIAAVAAARAA